MKVFARGVRSPARRPSGGTPARVGMAVLLSAAFIGAVGMLHVWRGVPVDMLTRDPAAITRMPSYTGFLSVAGIMFWTLAAGVCSLYAGVLRAAGSQRESVAFYGSGAALSALLAFDDAFMLHELVLPKLGIGEIYVIGAYGLLLGAFLVRFRKEILAAQYVLMAMALLLFAASLSFDMILPARNFLVEDGAKFAGIVCWTLFFHFSAIEENRSRSRAAGPHGRFLHGLRTPEGRYDSWPPSERTASRKYPT